MYTLRINTSVPRRDRYIARYTPTAELNVEIRPSPYFISSSEIRLMQSSRLYRANSYIFNRVSFAIRQFHKPHSAPAPKRVNYSVLLTSLNPFYVRIVSTPGDNYRGRRSFNIIRLTFGFCLWSKRRIGNLESVKIVPENRGRAKTTVFILNVYIAHSFSNVG